MSEVPDMALEASRRVAATPDIDIAKDVLAREAAALGVLADSLDESFSGVVSRIMKVNGRVICVGVGKSGHIARKIAATLSSTGTAAYFVHPTEASHGDLGMIQVNDVVFALSRSGETTELDDLIQYTRRFGVGLIAMTGQGGSSLARAADHVLLIPEVPEACEETQAPTTSTTMMLALGDALAIALLRRRSFDSSHFKLFHPGGRLGAMLKTAADLMHSGSLVPLVASGTSLADGLGELSEKGFGCVGITDADGRLAGVLTDGDLRRMIAANRQAVTVDEIMTPRPSTVRPGELAGALLQIMNDRKITQLFVVEDGRPVGIIHMHDILRAGVA